MIRWEPIPPLCRVVCINTLRSLQNPTCEKINLWNPVFSRLSEPRTLCSKEYVFGGILFLDFELPVGPHQGEVPGSWCPPAVEDFLNQIFLLSCHFLQAKKHFRANISPKHHVYLQERTASEPTGFQTGWYNVACRGQYNCLASIFTTHQSEHPKHGFFSKTTNKIQLKQD